MGIRSQTYETTIPIVITFIASIMSILDYFVEIPFINTISNEFRGTSSSIFAFTIILGSVSLISWQGKKFMKVTGKEKLYPLLLLSFLVIFMAVGFIFGVNSDIYQLIFVNIHMPISNTITALQGFWLIGVAYVGLRAKNIEGAALLVPAFLVMLGMAPIGVATWEGFVDISDWIVNYINSPGMRGIIISGALGLIVTSLRTMIGQEKGYIGG